jgi:hypothetical protein
LYIGSDPLPQVPEPASFILLASGLCGIGVGAWRKKIQLQ